MQKARKLALNAETVADIPRPLLFAGVIWFGASFATTKELGAAEGVAVGEAEGVETARDPSDAESPVGEGSMIAEAVVVDAESFDVGLNMDQLPYPCWGSARSNCRHEGGLPWRRRDVDRCDIGRPWAPPRGCSTTWTA